MKYYIAFFIFSTFSNQLYGQGMLSILDNSTNPGEVLVEFDDRQPDTKGTYYIHDTWNSGEIQFRSGTIVKGYPIRYDLQYDLLEIQVQDQVKVLPIRKMEGFQYFVDEPGSLIKFVPCAKFKCEDGVPLIGICRIYSKGEIGLYSRYDFFVKDPDYVVALDMGTVHKQIYIKERALLLMNNSMYPIPSRKKHIYELFGDKAGKAKEYTEREKLNLKKTANLKLLVEFINAEPVQ